MLGKWVYYGLMWWKLYSKISCLFFFLRRMNTAFSKISYA
nr:MAG TPA: Protein of unknown function (DUF1664) [Caudoviricetes sp.]